ncbi:MAG: type II toxin-antitoxin system RelE/ParE family toxin [Verrucomicrobiota bacterium]
MPQTFLTDDAKADFRVIIRRSRNQFGREAAKRYQKLINISILAIARNPDLINSKRYDSARKPVRIYHTRHSRNDAAINGVTVRTPRHIIVY